MFTWRRLWWNGGNFHETCLLGKDYGERVVRSQISWAQKFHREAFLEKETSERPEKSLRLTFCYQSVQKILEEVHVLLALNKKLKREFLDVPTVRVQKLEDS